MSADFDLYFLVLVYKGCVYITNLFFEFSLSGYNYVEHFNALSDFEK